MSYESPINLFRTDEFIEQYIVVQYEFDPRLIGTRFVGCLRVLERRG